LADTPHELRRGGFTCHRLGDRATVPVVDFLDVLARWVFDSSARGESVAPLLTSVWKTILPQLLTASW
jgi:hypothetical protein